MTTIIAATDFKRHSANVVGRAAQVARTLNARLILTHAVREGTRASVITQVRRRLEAELADLQDLHAVARVTEGKPETALARLARSDGAELLVLGLHRERAVLDLLRLTTMERTVLAADIPVLIAHNSPAPYQRVLAAVDFAPACNAALRVAARLAPGASLHVIHALHVPLIEKRPLRAVADTEAMHSARTDLKEWAADPTLPQGITAPEIIPGGVHDVLHFRVEELGADLLAIGSYSGRDPSILGNHARDLMRAPPTDILVAKPN